MKVTLVICLVLLIVACSEARRRWRQPINQRARGGTARGGTARGGMARGGMARGGGRRPQPQAALPPPGVTSHEEYMEYLMAQRYMQPYYRMQQQRWYPAAQQQAGGNTQSRELNDLDMDMDMDFN